MPVNCVQMNCTIIDELWFYPRLSSNKMICCICVFHEIITFHDWGWKHVLLCFSIAENMENIDFLPWISWVSLNQSEELESICVFWCHCKVELPIFVAGFRIQVDPTPFRCVVFISAKWWITKTWFSRWCESSSF
jgi:hypothetical protein